MRSKLLCKNMTTILERLINTILTEILSCKDKKKKLKLRKNHQQYFFAFYIIDQFSLQAIMKIVANPYAMCAHKMIDDSIFSSFGSIFFLCANVRCVLICHLFGDMIFTLQKMFT